METLGIRGLKFDFLVVSMSDKLAECFNYLEADGLIESDLTLREKYNKYLHPEVLDLENQQMWKDLWSNQIISVFQFDSPVGVQAARDIKPENIEQLTAANSLMRLMSESGETPMERYVRMKGDMSLWYKEVKEAELTDAEIKVLEKYYLPSFGTPATQEEVMLALMDPSICGMELSEVDKARKIIGKKLMNQIPDLKEKIFSKATSKELAQYLWDTMVLPQLGYSFSKLHSLAYSFVGVQSMTMATKFPRVYWNTAVLAVDSGSSADATGGVDYDKVAKAMGTIKRAGISVRLPDVNSSDARFQPVSDENIILFGLKAIRNVSDDFITNIINSRPYSSIDDFIVKVMPTKTQMIALIKSGAFDKFEDRVEAMKHFLSITSKPKAKITMQNLEGLMTMNLLSDEMFLQEKRYVRFNKRLKAEQKKGSGTSVYYLLDGHFQAFYEEFLDTDLLETLDGNLIIQHKVWDKYYKRLVAPIADYIKANNPTLLEKFNSNLIEEEWTKYAKGSIGHWEITQLGFINSSHELFDVNLDQYGVSSFDELPSTPISESSFTTKMGKEIKLFNIDKITGVVCGKDKLKGLVYILANTGVIECKMPREQFAEYDRQLSETQADGTKRVVSKSTFTVGNKLLLQGYRRDDLFFVKTYGRTVGHSLYLIEDIVDGELVFGVNRFN